MIDLLTNPNFLATLAVVAISVIVFVWAIWERQRHAFPDDARLFELNRNLRDEVVIRERIMARVYELEERVARLEDPQGKKKRDHGIYELDPVQAIPGLIALQERMLELGYAGPDYLGPAAQIASDLTTYNQQVLAMRRSLTNDGELKDSR